MKAIRYVLFATALLLFASCGRQPSDIIESSPNGVTGVKMPILVTFKENVEPKEDRIREAVSISPSVDFDVYLSGMRMLRIIPRSPLKYDTRYKVTIDAAKLTGRQLKGVAEFEFATPKLRFAYSDYWLQQSDDMTSYVLVGEVVSSDYAESGYVEKNLKISGLKNPDVAWVHSANGTTHQYTVGNIAPGEGAGYTLTLDFGYGDSKTLTVEVPKKDEYVVLDHSVAAEPLAVVVTFSEPLKQNQNLKDLIRFDTKFRTSVDKNRLYIYPESHVTGNFDIEISRNVLSKGGQRLKESYTFTANLPSRVPAIRFAGKGSVLPSSNDMSLLFESVNYRKARVRVRKIFANNLLQFFQQNYYGGDYYSDMDYVSRIVRDTTVDLSAKASTKLDLSNTYSLDLSRLITDGRKSMYLLEIKGVEPLVPTDEYDYDYYFGDYRTYRERSKLVLQSDIGIICKSSGEEEYVVYTTGPAVSPAQRGLQGTGLRQAEPDLGGSVHRFRRPRRAEMQGGALHRSGRSRRTARLRQGGAGRGAVTEQFRRRGHHQPQRHEGFSVRRARRMAARRRHLPHLHRHVRQSAAGKPSGVRGVLQPQRAAGADAGQQRLLGRHLHVQTRNDAGGAYRTVAGARKSGRRGIRKSDPRGRHQAQPNENRHAAR